MHSIDKIEQHRAIELLNDSGRDFLSLFKQGNLEVEIYKPHLVDNQTPHDRDEFYLVISGKGKFQLCERVVGFGPGDFLYVPRGAEHRFFEFTDDFITWVFFIGQ